MPTPMKMHYTGCSAELLRALSHPHIALGKPGFVVMRCLEIQQFFAFAVAACTGIWRSEILSADYVCPQRSGPFKWMKKGCSACHQSAPVQKWCEIDFISSPSRMVWELFSRSAKQVVDFHYPHSYVCVLCRKRRRFCCWGHLMQITIWRLEKWPCFYSLAYSSSMTLKARPCSMNCVLLSSCVCAHWWFQRVLSYLQSWI